MKFGTELAKGVCAGRLVCVKAGVAEEGRPTEEGGDVGFGREESSEKEHIPHRIACGSHHQVEDELVDSLEIGRFILDL